MVVGPEVFAVVLAGGRGSRFWPKSRLKLPKQLNPMGPDRIPLISQTLSRLDGFIPPENRLIVTNTAQLESTRALAGDECGMYLAEPEGRNTAAALTLAALHIQAVSKFESPLMLVLSADHFIPNQEQFRVSMEQAILAARGGKLVLCGVKPRYPETGFGYIERGGELQAGIFSVAHFREKPDTATANSYLQSGIHYWNAGIFSWQTEAYLKEVQKYLPETYGKLAPLAQANTGFGGNYGGTLADVYSALQDIPVDKAILEVSPNSIMIEADFDWQDLGSWDALEKCFPTDSNGNLSLGDTLILDSKGCTVEGDGRFVSCIGMTDVVIAATDVGVLVCPKSRAQDVKRVVSWLEEQGRFDLT